MYTVCSPSLSGTHTQPEGLIQACHVLKHLINTADSLLLLEHLKDFSFSLHLKTTNSRESCSKDIVALYDIWTSVSRHLVTSVNCTWHRLMLTNPAGLWWLTSRDNRGKYKFGFVISWQWISAHADFHLVKWVSRVCTKAQLWASGWYNKNNQCLAQALCQRTILRHFTWEFPFYANLYS